MRKETGCVENFKRCFRGLRLRKANKKQEWPEKRVREARLLTGVFREATGRSLRSHLLGEE